MFPGEALAKFSDYVGLMNAMQSGDMRGALGRPLRLRRDGRDGAVYDGCAQLGGSLQRRWYDLDEAAEIALSEGLTRFSQIFPDPVLVVGKIARGRLRRPAGADARATMQHNAGTSPSMDGDDRPNHARFIRVVPRVHSVHTIPDPSNWITIGRIMGNDMVINDYTISKQHARIRRDEPDGWWIEDLGSTNWTWVDGERLQRDIETRLNSGNPLRMGRIQFTFLESADFFRFLCREA